MTTEKGNKDQSHLVRVKAVGFDRILEGPVELMAPPMGVQPQRRETMSDGDRKEEFPQEAMLQFFAYDHLPPHLKSVSAHFRGLALVLISDLPRNPERTVALRKLLEAKDCAVRAVLYK